MGRDLQSIKEAALALDIQERALLVDELVFSIAGKPEHIQSSLESSAREAKRRSDAYDRGELPTVDGREAIARVRKLVTR